MPVVVGALSTEKETLYGQIFSKYLADPKNLFIISSDFCHWGQRFRYTFYERSWGEIHQSIKTLDHKVKIYCMLHSVQNEISCKRQPVFVSGSQKLSSTSLH